MKPLVMIVIFCSILFTKVFAQKEIYIFGYRRPIYSSELESVYIVEREIMGDTIVITEFIQHSNTKF